MPHLYDYIKIQACTFKRTKESLHTEFGFASVKAFGVSDLNWIVDSEGKRLPRVYDYTLLNLPFGCACNETLIEG